MDSDELVTGGCECQFGNMTFGVGQKLKCESDKTGLGCMWLNPQESSLTTLFKLIKQRSNDIKRQAAFANMGEKRSLIFYSEMKLG
jgi:hypothetical protein